MGQATSSDGPKFLIKGFPALSTHSFTGPDGPPFKTFIVKKLLEKRYLTLPAFCASFAHTREIGRTYLSDLAHVFPVLAAAAQDNLLDFLPDGVAQSGFGGMS